MNKIPLSLVALAAVGAPATAQAVTYQDLHSQVSDLINQVGKAIGDFDNTYPVLVNNDGDKATYESIMTGISKDLGIIMGKLSGYETSTANAPEESVSSFTLLQSKYNGVNANFTAKADLLTKYNTLSSLYSSRLTTVNNLGDTTDKLETTTSFKDYKTAQLKALNIEGVKTTINGYDLENITSGISQAEKELVAKIEGTDGKGGLTAEVNKLTCNNDGIENLSARKTLYDKNAAAQKSLSEQITAAKAEYDDALNDVSSVFEKDYPGWYKNMTNTEINEQGEYAGELALALNRIVEEERQCALNAPKLNDETDTFITLLNEKGDGKLLAEATDIITTVTAKYTALKNAYEVAAAAVKTLAGKFETLTEALQAAGEYEANKAALDAIDAAITALNDDVEAKKDVSTVLADFSIDSRNTAITNDINKLYTPNLEGYAKALEAIAEVEGDLDDAVAAATKAVSKDGAYNAAVHFTTTESNIRQALNELRAEAKAKYLAGAAADYEPDLDDVNDDVADYSVDAKRALDAYNTYAPTLKSLTDALNALSTTVGSYGNVPVVSLNGNVTYGDVIAAVNETLTKVNAAVKAANAKDGSDHADALETIADENYDWGTYTVTQLTAFKASFAADKAAYDNVVALNAAETMYSVTQSQLGTLYNSYSELIADITIYGNQGTTIQTAAKAAMDKIGAETARNTYTANSLRAAIKVEYDKIEKAETDAAKNVAATNFLAYLATIDIDDLNAGYTALKADADAAALNLKTYSELCNLEASATVEGSVLKAIEDEKTKVDGVTEGEAANYYKTKVLGGTYTNEVTKWLAAVKADYDAGNSAANKAKRLQERTALLELVKAVSGQAEANQLAYDELIKKTSAEKVDNGLEYRRSTLYNKILTGDQSLQATEYLAELITIGNEITALNANLTNDWKTGNSVLNKATRQGTIDDLSSRITSIEGAQYDGYAKAIYETNLISDNRFEAAYNLVLEEFAAAVRTLGEFNAVTAEEIKDIVESSDMLETHARIYSYADKLRQLYADEKEQYDFYQSAANLEQEDHSKIQIFEAASFIAQANNYKVDLQKELETYCNDVNAAVYANFSGALNAANTALDNSVKVLMQREYLALGTNLDVTDPAQVAAARKIAYATTDEAVAEALKAAGTAPAGVPEDLLFATVIDKYYSTLNSVTKDIATANETLAKNEATARYNALNSIVTGDLTKLAGFAPTGEVVTQADIDAAKLALTKLVGGRHNGVNYSNSLSIEYNSFIKAGNYHDNVEAYKVDLENAVTIGKYHLPNAANDADLTDHTKDFGDISEALYMYAVNGDFFNKVVTEAEAIKDGLADVIDFVNQFYTTHTLSSNTDAAITKILNDLTADVDLAEGRWQTGGDVQSIYNRLKNYRTGTGTNDLNGQIASIRQSVIDEELTTLFAEISGVKEDYNKAFTTSVEENDTEKRAALAALEPDIAALTTTYNALLAKWATHTGQDVDVDELIEEMTTELLSFESEIAVLKNTLIGYYDSAALDNAKNAFATAVKPLETLIATYEDAMELFAETTMEKAAVEEECGDLYESILAAYNNLVAEKEGRVEAGSLLFYADNLVNDANDLVDADNVVDRVNSLTLLVKKYDANLKAKQYLDKHIVTFKEDLTTAYEEVCKYVELKKAPFVDETDPKNPTDNRDTEKTSIEKKIETYEKKIQSDYDAVALKLNAAGNDADIYGNVFPGIGYSSNLYINTLIDTYWDDMTNEYARYLVTGILTDSIKNKLDVYIADGAKEDSQFTEEELLTRKRYVPETLNALVKRTAQLRTDLNYLLEYNKQSHDNDRVNIEVTGEKVINPTTNLQTTKPVPYRPGEDETKEYGWTTVQSRYADLLAEVKSLLDLAENDYYILGDADGNRKVNVNDWFTVREFVLDAKEVKDVVADPVYGAKAAYAADMDGNDYYSINDLVSVANRVFAWNVTKDVIEETTTVQARVQARVPVQSNDAITLAAVSEETSVFGKNIRLAVNLDNSVNYVGYQMDIKLPAGMTLVSESLTERANGHELVSNDVNGMHRVLAATIENNAFLNDGDAVLYLDVQVGSDYNGGEVEINNIIFSDAEGRMYNLGGLNTNAPTGIDSITAPTVSERIYSVGGQMMKAVKKGVNIIIGNDGSAKKVIKK